MISSIELNALSEGTLQENLPLASHTTFRTGGAAAFFVSPKTEEGLAALLARLRETETPYFILGRGSNLLVSDRGYPGVIVSLREFMNGIFCEGTTITAGGGAMLYEIAKEAEKRGLAGLEFAAGIPGTAGGALRMNAGAYGSEMKDVVLHARLLRPDGEICTLENRELAFRYRGSLVEDSGDVVLSVAYGLTEDDPLKIRERTEELLLRRREKQPLEYGSAGSTFKRPEGYFAGKLIEDCGLKGARIGDACVSTKHAGFIVNLGNASSEDVYRLILKVQDTVYEKTGVRLEREVLLLGEF